MYIKICKIIIKAYIHDLYAHYLSGVNTLKSDDQYSAFIIIPELYTTIFHISNFTYFFK